MAYNFYAEKNGNQDLRVLLEDLSSFCLTEFFPIEVTEVSVSLGISIPFKAIDDPRFEYEFEKVISYLINDREFHVIDLFTGNAVSSGDISSLARQISA